jgi:hypothetical protein
MRIRGKHMWPGLTATLIMGLAVDSASANRLSASAGRYRLTWAALRFFADNESGTPAITCSVTIEGSFHSATIRKVTGALIGAATRGIVKSESCGGGNATILQEALPWHVTYEGFRGTLPTISGVEFLVRRYAFRIEASGFGVACLYLDRGRVEENLMGTVAVGAGGQVTSDLPASNRHAQRSAESSILCPQFGKFEGAGQAFVLGSTNRISVTLI